MFGEDGYNVTVRRCRLKIHIRFFFCTGCKIEVRILIQLLMSSLFAAGAIDRRLLCRSVEGLCIEITWFCTLLCFFSKFIIIQSGIVGKLFSEERV